MSGHCGEMVVLEYRQEVKVGNRVELMQIAQGINRGLESQFKVAADAVLDPHPCHRYTLIS